MATDASPTPRPSLAYWSIEEELVLEALDTSLHGLSEAEVHRRAEEQSLTRLPRRHSAGALMWRQFRSPIVLLLLVSAFLSALFTDLAEALITFTIVVLSGLLGFVQERGAVKVIDDLLDSVEAHVTVLREGCPTRVVASEVVPGDILLMEAGTLVPGDCRVLETSLLLVDESTLTGEDYPHHKEAGQVPRESPPHERNNVVYMGTHVTSGSGRAVVVHTGSASMYGELTVHTSRQHVPTSFERGVTQYGMMLVRATVILVAGVFVANVLLHRPIAESLLFSLALAVGLTPQMLPAIVTLSLSIGARLLARRKVIVKRLDSIEDLGSMSVLCSDKTGTLTTGQIALRGAFDPEGRPDETVLRLGRVNAATQKGFDNPIDQVLLVEAGGRDPLPVLIREVPFDFTRRMLTVLVRGDRDLVVTKGAVDSVLRCCTKVWSETGEGEEIAGRRESIARVARELTAEGTRTLAVAIRALDSREVAAEDDLESGLVFRGFLVFEDPMKTGAPEAVAALHGLGIRLVLVTGDSVDSARHIARQVGLDQSRVMTGGDISTLTPEELSAVMREVSVVADVAPLQKEQIVDAFRAGGYSVGFIGDGINDVAAIHTADVGISVDTAVDVARSAADLLLLDKDLGVVAAGVRAGRRVFRNTLKYVHVTTSANFGNMVSLALATLFLPYLPMLPLQVLLLNLLSDIPGMTVATDRVDPEQLWQPSRWEMADLRRFMVIFGLISTCADLASFAVLRGVLGLGAADLRSAWFVESTVTEVLTLLSLRTSRPLWRSRPGGPLVISSVIVALFSMVLVAVPWGETLGFSRPNLDVVAAMTLISFGFLALLEAGKAMWMGRAAERPLGRRRGLRASDSGEATADRDGDPGVAADQ